MEHSSNDPSRHVLYFGEWGTGPDDPYCTDLRNVYFAFNSGALTFRGYAKVPRAWSKARVRKHGVLRHASDLEVSFDVRILADRFNVEK